MKKTTLFVLTLFIGAFALGQEKAFTLFNTKGKKVRYSKMIKKLSQKEVVLFGELHNNPIAHWLAYEVALDLSQKKQLILGAEMFETDNQSALTAYVQGKIDQKQLDSLARLWSNYHTDYKPLVDFSKQNQLPFVATNAPRSYALQVYRNGFKGLDSISKTAQSLIAPLPIALDTELPSYKSLLEGMVHHGGLNLVKAQAIKDATMAHFIAKNLVKDQLFFHLNGAYHSDFHEGIVWYLKNENPLLEVATLTTVSQENIDKLHEEHLNRADFIICVDADMTTSY